MSFSNAQFVILAGGLGTRLRSVVSSKPKTMASVANRPFLEYLLQQLVDQGVLQVTIATGYLSSEISEHFGEEWRGLSINYSVETTPLGTGGALLNAVDIEAEITVAINGDTFQEISYKSIVEALAEDDDGVLAVRKVEDSSDFGSVLVTKEGYISQFGEKTETQSGLIYSGVACLKIAKLGRLVSKKISMKDPVSLEREILPRLINGGRVRALSSDGVFIDIGTPSRLGLAQSIMGER
jgi:D-glycero-alpha-D-manno-heptose 1-phosphate guanylyltransferase